MEIIKTPLQDLIIIKPIIFKDERGDFYEVYHEDKFELMGVKLRFVQDNQSVSKKGVIRGLHFQKPPFAQAKLVRVVQGSAIDVAVDLRKSSSTYGMHYSLVLSSDNHLQLFIPAGFAHGFAALEDDTVLSYKCSNYYQKESEGTLSFNDPDLNIHWLIENPIVSAKDRQGLLLKNFVSPF